MRDDEAIWRSMLANMPLDLLMVELTRRGYSVYARKTEPISWPARQVEIDTLMWDGRRWLRCYEDE